MLKHCAFNENGWPERCFEVVGGETDREYTSSDANEVSVFVLSLLVKVGQLSQVHIVYHFI